MSLALSNQARQQQGEGEGLKRAAALAERVKEMSQTTPIGKTPSQSGAWGLRVDRSRDWMRETDQKLAVLAGKVMGVLVTSEQWRVRRGVVIWAHCLLGNCRMSLVTTAPVLLEALLTLSHDSYPQVSSVAALSLVSSLFPAQLSCGSTLPCRSCSRSSMLRKV